jgi:hypothetical protein
MVTTHNTMILEVPINIFIKHIWVFILMSAPILRSTHIINHQGLQPTMPPGSRQSCQSNPGPKVLLVKSVTPAGFNPFHSKLLCVDICVHQITPH